MIMEDKQINLLIATEVLKVLERLEDSKQKDFWETLLTIKKEYNDQAQNNNKSCSKQT